MIILQSAADKLASLIERRDGPLTIPLMQWLKRSAALPRDTEREFAIGRWLGLDDLNAITIRKLWINRSTTAYLIVYFDKIVEVITHTGFRRTIQKRWQYVGGIATEIDGGRDGDRFSAAYKHKRPKQVGGGLMRGRLTPRRASLSIISTRSLKSPTEK